MEPTEKYKLALLRRMIPSTAIEWLVILVVAGVLAAIALPAYQQYTVRAKVSDAPLAVRALLTATRGSSVLSAQTEARQYTEFEARLFVSGEELGKAVRLVESQSAPGTKADGMQVLVYDRMSAQLIGKDFVIQPPEAKVQWVDPVKGATWTWTLYGMWPGDRVLHAKLSAVIKVQDQEAEHSFEVAKHTVSVRVDAREMVMRNLELVLTAIAIPAIGWLLARMWNRKRSSNSTNRQGDTEDD